MERLAPITPEACLSYRFHSDCPFTSTSSISVSTTNGHFCIVQGSNDICLFLFEFKIIAFLFSMYTIM